MIEEAMKAVKEAEAKAEEIIRAAHREANEMKDAVRERIRTAKIEGEKDAEERREDALAKAKEAGETALAEARQEATREAEALKAVAAEKEEVAVQAVIDALVPKA